MKRFMSALKLGLLTAVWIFVGIVGACAFAYIPTDAQVTRIYRFAGYCAGAGFLVQMIRVCVFKKRRSG